MLLKFSCVGWKHPLFSCLYPVTFLTCVHCGASWRAKLKQYTIQGETHIILGFFLILTPCITNNSYCLTPSHLALISPTDYQVQPTNKPINWCNSLSCIVSANLTDTVINHYCHFRCQSLPVKMFPNLVPSFQILLCLKRFETFACSFGSCSFLQ